MRKRIIYGLVAMAMAGGCAFAQSSGEVLQQALYSEQIEGDLPAAIAGYQQIIDQKGALAKHVAQALYRQGMCYVQLKQDVKAQAVLSRLVAEHAGQSDLVKKALPILDSILGFDPASLMPPETVAYLELGSTGEQVGMILEMLKGTLLEDQLLSIFQSHRDPFGNGLGPIIAGFLDPMMQEDFKKIRGLAIGVIDVSPEGPDAVGVLHFGESTMLRGLLMTGLSMVARPTGVVDGMQTYTVNGEINIACGDNVLLVGPSKGRLPWMIRQYKGLSLDASLASGNREFRTLDRVDRRKNLVTVWANTDAVYERLVLQAQKAQVQMSGEIVHLASIDNLTLSASLDADTIGLNGRVRFKDGMSNTIYEMIKTANIGCDGMKGVPANAIGLVSFDLADSSSIQVAQLRQLALANLGVDLSPELFDSLEQITLFVVPDEDRDKPPLSSQSDVSIQIGNRMQLGLVIQILDSAPVAAFLQQMDPMLKETGHKSKIVDGHVVVAMELDVIDAVAKTLAGAPSAADAGKLSAVLNEVAGSAEKLVLVDVAAYARRSRVEYRTAGQELGQEELIRIAEAGYEALGDALEGTMLSIHTEEERDELALQIQLSGIPKLNGVFEAVQQINKAESMIRMNQNRSSVTERQTTVEAQPEAREE